jgi:hypothetical protein
VPEDNHFPVGKYCGFHAGNFRRHGAGGDRRSYEHGDERK